MPLFPPRWGPLYTSYLAMDHSPETSGHGGIPVAMWGRMPSVGVSCRRHPRKRLVLPCALAMAGCMCLVALWRPFPVHTGGSWRMPPPAVDQHGGSSNIRDGSSSANGSPAFAASAADDQGDRMLPPAEVRGFNGGDAGLMARRHLLEEPLADGSFNSSLKPVWERCDYEQEHAPAVFVLLYVGLAGDQPPSLPACLRARLPTACLRICLHAAELHVSLYLVVCCCRAS